MVAGSRMLLLPSSGLWTAKSSSVRRQYRQAPSTLCRALTLSQEQIRDRVPLATGSPDWAELYGASQLSIWSGLCYLQPGLLRETLKQQGLRLLDSGRNSFTSWYIAEGAISYAPLLERLHVLGATPADASSLASHTISDTKALERQRKIFPHRSAWPHTAEPVLAPADSSNGSHGNSSNSSGSNGKAVGGSSKGGQGRISTPAATAGGSQRPIRSPSSLAAAAAEVTTRQPPPCQRFVFVRGVQWSAHDLDVLHVWRQLGRMWPEPYLASLTRPPGCLHAYSGIARAADQLWQDMAPSLAAAAGMDQSSSSPHGPPICLAGHSMGGALAQLLLCRLRLEAGIPAERLSCFSFGSPPVLAHRDGGGTWRVLSALGVTPQRVISVAAQHDPVPRALSAADVAFSALATSDAGQRLLTWREQLLGKGSLLSSGRFLFEHAGRALLLRSAANGEPEAVWLPAEQLSTALRSGEAAASSRPQAQLQAWLAHHHSSYSAALLNATVSALCTSTRPSSDSVRGD